MKHRLRSRGRLIPDPLTPQEIDYIQGHLSDQSAIQLAASLRRDPRKIYAYLYEQGLKAKGWRGRRELAETGYFDVNAVRGEYTWLV
jgi:hypothetical protein